MTPGSDQAPLPLLVVDDEQSMREFLTIMLRKDGYALEVAETGDAAIERLARGDRFSLILTDLKMPGTAGGLEVLRAAREADPACQVVMMTAHATTETAITAIRQGAYDYLTKPFKLDEIRVVVERALEKHALLAENYYLKQALADRESTGDIIGRSEPMRKVFSLIARVAPTRTTVLVQGESGTGKELVAQAIHAQSGLKGRFVPVNCGAIPESLIEAELFGYKKGAFTGADADRIGLFEAANGGTIFLDEIGELPLNTQVRLLRVLQDKRVKPVGGTEERDVDCRIVAATNRDLREEVDQGRFREDLYYRLNVIPIELPPLRERGGDIKLLIEHFIERMREEIGNPIEGVESDALHLLLRHDYPGNIRELQNIIERAVTLEHGPLITIDSLPSQLLTRRATGVPVDLTLPEGGCDLEGIVEELERDLIGKALVRTEGNKTDAAKLLGISFRALRYRLQKYDIDNDD